MSTTTESTVVGKVHDYLKANINVELLRRPKFGTFVPSDEGVLGELWRTDVVVPCVVDATGGDGNDNGGWVTSDSSPRLLLYDLENEDHQKSETFRHITSQQDVGPTCLYGTSGAGKTRAIFEYLAQKKGLYLLAGDFERNPGSKDLNRIFLDVGELTDPSAVDGLQVSEKNLKKVLCRYRILLYVRHAVHSFLEQHLGELSPLEWLLFQLYPVDLLGRDIFLGATRECINKGFDDSFSASEEARLRVDYNWPIFVDESQRLLSEKNGTFLSKDGSEVRSNFSALMKAMDTDRSDLDKRNFVKWPVFSGTGYSSVDLDREGGSASAKFTSKEAHRKSFSGFELLNEGGVEEYLNKFLDLTKVRDDVKKHVARWLRGRPRWTATFMEIYVQRKRKSSIPDMTRVRGDFKKSDKDMLEALDRFLAVMTCDPETPNRRTSWNAGMTSAYHSVKSLMSSKRAEAREAQSSLRNAVFRFAVGKRDTIFEDPSKCLIEAGVAAVKVSDTDGKYVKAVLDEPIIVQAGINYFCLASYLRKNLMVQENNGLGQAFERVLLPVLLQDDKGTLKAHFQKQLKDSKAQQLEGFFPSTKSSYGVLTLDTGEASLDAMKATIKWIEAAVNCTIEGQVEPYCYPDNNFGPDVLYLMWNKLFSDFRSCLVQSKYEKYDHQADALRTLVPDWLYYKKRNKPAERQLNLPDSLTQKWNAVKHKLVSNSRPCLRLLVQCPAELKWEKVAGQVASDGYKPSDTKAKQEKRDWLVAISKNDLELFDDDTASIIRLVKKPKMTTE